MMLSCLVALAAPLALLAASAIQQEHESPPRLCVEPPFLDAGVVLQGETKVLEYQVENCSKYEVTIQNVTTSCGCAVARIRHGKDNAEVLVPKNQPLGSRKLLSLKPGDDMRIEVTFNSTGQLTRTLNKYIEIHSDDPSHPKMRLNFAIRVKQAATVEPKMLQLGEVTPGSGASGRITVTPNPGVAMEITAVRPSPQIETQLTRVETEDGRPSYVIDVSLAAGAPVGHLSRTLAIETNLTGLPLLKVPVFANVLSTVQITTQNAFNSKVLNFGVVAPGTSVTQSIDITNARPDVPFLVREVSVDSKFSDSLRAEVVTLEEGARYRIDVTTDESLTAKFFKGVVVIRADHPELKETRISFNGWVKTK